MRTKQALSAALKKLLTEKPLQKITIQDLTGACGISRMAFYYHFKDIYDLVEWCFKTQIIGALETDITIQNWTGALSAVCATMLENRGFILNVYRSVGREQIERYLYRTGHALARRLVDAVAPPDADAADREFLADFYKYAIVGLMLAWADAGMSENPERMLGRLEAVVTAGARPALTRLGHVLL